MEEDKIHFEAKNKFQFGTVKSGFGNSSTATAEWH